MPMLAKGSDAALSLAVRNDLSRPADTEAQVKPTGKMATDS